MIWKNFLTQNAQNHSSWGVLRWNIYEAFWGRYVHIHHYIYDMALKSISNADVTSIKNLILQRAMNVLFIPTKLNRMLSTWQNFFEIEKMLKSPDSSDHKEEMRPKFFPKVSFSHNKLNLCTSQAKKLRWSEEVITSSLQTKYLFSKVFFLIAALWKYQRDWTYRIHHCLKHTT